VRVYLTHLEVSGARLWGAATEPIELNQGLPR